MSASERDRRLFLGRLESDRLRFERLSAETVDVLELYEILAHDDGIEEVTAHVPWSPHETPKETADFLDRAERNWENGAKLKYVVRPKTGEDGAREFAGVAVCWLEWDRRAATLGFWLRKRFWGRGYSGERAATELELAFDRLDLEVVRIGHTLANDRSRRAIERYVDRFGGDSDGIHRNSVPFDGEVRDQRLYAITREGYRRAIGD